MNIIHIGNVGLKSNGVGQVIEKLTIFQRHLGHSVTALTARIKKEELPLFKEVNTVNSFSAIISNNKPDIVIFHSLYIWEYIAFYKYLIKKKIPYLIQLHGALSEENYKKNHLKKWLANTLFYNRFIKNAQRIIYLNQGEYSKSIVPKINNKCAIIPNGVEINQNYRKNDNTDIIRILYLGRIASYHKGLDILIEAIKILESKKLSDKIHFEFYGTGEDKAIEVFKDQINEISKIASFHGPAYGELKEHVLSNSNIFILTSRFEGMPMGILEALAHRIPCIVTPQTNMANIIHDGQCGWVTELDANSIAEITEKAISEYQTNYETLQCNAQNTAGQFSWDIIAERTISLYEDIIANYTKRFDNI